MPPEIPAIVGLVLGPPFSIALGAEATLPSRPISMADLLLLHTPADPKVSPDGRFVAFTVSVADTVESRTLTDIWVASTGGSGPARRFTSGLEAETAPRWSPDGSWLAFVTSRPGGISGQGRPIGTKEADGKSQVWILPVQGGEAFRLTSAAEGVEGYEWAPDGSSVVYMTTAERPAPEKRRRDAEARRKKDAVVEDSDRRPKEFHLQPIQGRGRRLWVGDPGVGDWDLSPQGDRIVYSSNATGFRDDESFFDLWVASLADSTCRRLTSRYGPETGPVFSPDGRWIAIQADQDTSVTFSQEEIFVISSGGGAMRCLTSTHDHSVTLPQWSSDGRSIIGETALGADNGFLEAPLNGDRPRILGGGKVSDWPAYSSELSISDRANVMAWIGDGPESWAEVWVSVRGGKPRRLTAFNREAEPFDWPKIEPIRWRSNDGLDITGLLVVPPEHASRPPFATIAYPHGGPFNRTTRRLRGIMTSIVLASHGYLVYHPNFRGSRGFGEAFGQASRGDLGGGDLEDLLSGLDSLVAWGMADPKRLGITGGSYGGYLTNWAIANTDRFKAAVSLYGIFSFITDFSTSTAPSYEREYFGGNYWERESLYVERSPMSRVDRIHAPVLILHGDDDTVTSPVNSREMWTALKVLKRTVEFVHYPRERHGFREPNHRIDAAQRTLEWFDRYVRSHGP